MRSLQYQFILFQNIEIILTLPLFDTLSFANLRKSKSKHVGQGNSLYMSSSESSASSNEISVNRDEESGEIDLDTLLKSSVR